MSKQPAITLLIKPASGSCNLRCRYCFYADEMNLRSEPTRGFMNEETLEILVKRRCSRYPMRPRSPFREGSLRWWDWISIGI